MINANQKEPNMQHAVPNHATFQVAETTGVSGRVTAESVKRGLYANKQSSLSGIWRLTIFSSVAWVAVLAAFAPTPVRARDGDENQIAELKEQVATLQSQVRTLQTELAAVQSNKALALGPYVSVVMGLVDGVNGPHIYFTGANIHIVSGHTTTADTVTGLGNLIIGYDELFPGQVPNRGGSHNLVIGRFHSFTSSAFGGLVAGERNTISAVEASVSGGQRNTASGIFASVSGGIGNTASADFASVSGGSSNTASGRVAASVSGGQGNTASGNFASVSGGIGNTASGPFSSVIGGQGNTADIGLSIRPQPPFP
jgi:hypothetical protein